MNQTKIEWCDCTWNPVTGCLHGCKYCYARRIAHRFGLSQKQNGEIHTLNEPVMLDNSPGGDFEMPQPIKDSYPFEFDPTFHRYRLNEPEQEKKPQNIFAVSMGDLFGDWVPQTWISEVFAACKRAPRHRYLFLTKNPKGIDEFIDHDSDNGRGTFQSIDFYAPFWFGTSVTNSADLEKAKILSSIREGHRFLSIEPLLGLVDLNLEKGRCPVCGSDMIYEDNPKTRGDESPIYCDDCGWAGNDREELKPGIEWVIIGAETGNRKGKIIPQRLWVEDIVQSCRTGGIPVFMKGSLAKVWGAPLIQEFPWEAQDG